MKIRINKKLKAVSLIEMIVVVALLSSLSLIMSRFLIQGFSNYKNGKQGIDLEQDGARVMRDFEYSARALTDIKIATETEFSFLRYYDLTSVSPNQIRYFLDNTVFQSGITSPFGTPPNAAYPVNNEQIHYLIENVEHASFKYYDDNNVELSAPINIPSIRMVQLTLTLKISGSNHASSTTQTTKVNLRNLKKNL